MKRFFIIALAIIFAVGFAADMAFAGDFSVSGTMRVRAWDKDNWDFNDTLDDEAEYWDQRLRTAFTFTAAEGISAHLRTDWSEYTWGDSTWTGSRPSSDSELQVDRAYLQIVQEGYKIKAGQLYASLGNTIAYDNNQPGILADIGYKMPVTITLGFLKEDEGSTTSSDDDVDHLLGNVAFASGAFSLNIFAVLQDADSGDEPTLFGIQGKTSIGRIALNAEIDTFGGDDGAGRDYVGTQAYINAEMKFGDQFTGGLDVVYAAGTDDPAGEQQLTHINGVFGDWCIMDRGPFQADLAYYDEMNPAGSIYDANGVPGAGGGAMGLGFYADFSAMENVMLQASVLYTIIDEDSFYGIDTVSTINLGVDWKFAPNTSLAGQFNTTSVDADSGLPFDDSTTTAVARLQVKF
jgi:hypothetical protein